jgi:excisionase family DNA binding protein
MQLAMHHLHAGQCHARRTAEQWLTLAEAAAALGVSPDTVRRRIRRGELVARHDARQLRVRVDSVHDAMHGSTHGTAAQLHGNSDQVADLRA